jgi:hypothetical protein
MDEGVLVTQPPQAQTPIPASASSEADVAEGSADVRVKLFARTDVGPVREHNGHRPARRRLRGVRRHGRRRRR